MWKEAVMALILRHYPGIRLERRMETSEDLSQDSRCPGRYLNPGSPEYKAVLTSRQRLSAALWSIYQLIHFQGRGVKGRLSIDVAMELYIFCYSSNIKSVDMTAGIVIALPWRLREHLTFAFYSRVEFSSPAMRYSRELHLIGKRNVYKEADASPMLRLYYQQIASI
jgi:hypothetical protein